MTKRTIIGIVFSLLVATGMAIALLLHGESPKRRSVTFTTMGTVCRLDWYATEKVADAATLAADRAFQEVTAACNLRDAKSEISFLNATAAAEPFVCSDVLWELLQQARHAFIESDGAFDISVKPMMDLWGFYRKRETIPPPAEIAMAHRLVGLNHVVFDDVRHSVYFMQKGMALDLDGIAKGFALDRAAKAAQACGVRRGALDLGGNLRLLEPYPGKNGFSVGIKSPGASHCTLKCAELQHLSGNVGVSTSGNYERYVVYKGKRYGHILNARTGLPAEYRYSATVVAPDATTADWLSTTCYLRPDLAPKFRQKGWIVVLVEP